VGGREKKREREKERESKFVYRTYLIASGMEIEIFQLRIR
jgi:hypothetical protein